jgi:dienelactone hydrolase
MLVFTPGRQDLRKHRGGTNLRTDRLWCCVLGALFVWGSLVVCSSLSAAEDPPAASLDPPRDSGTDRDRRAAVLEHLLETFRSDVPGEEPKGVPIWESWLRRTGELPPDFDPLPARALPPDLLTFQDGRPVTDSRQWAARREEIRSVLQQYMFGNWPPPPEKIAIKYQASKAEDHEVYFRQNVQLWFAPSVQAVEFAERTYSYNPGLTPETRRDRANHLLAILNVELIVPKGSGPFPAIVEIGPVNMDRDLPRVQRGYLVARFSRLDADYIAAVYTDYECNQLEWWAYAAGRCVDLLVAREDVDRSKIALSGHSRGGKTAMIAALMDERVDALINSHPGTAAGSYNLWRYAGEKYGGETLENSTRRFQYWNHPRMRFFIGRENKMPFDSHFLLGLFAPRPALLGTGERDHVGQAWGDQQCYLAVKQVYKLLESENRLGFYASAGGHEVTPAMNHAHLDWLDMQFGRKAFDFPQRLIYTYTFDQWQEITGETLNPNELPEKDLTDILRMPNGSQVRTIDQWQEKADDVRSRIRQMIGPLPAYDKIENITVEKERRFRGNLVKASIPIDDKLVAHLTYPADRDEKIPAVIYLHAYLDAGGHEWSRGYGYRTSVGERLAEFGFLAIEFDQFGYASRNRDSGIEFYRENPQLSALGVMIQDVRKILDALSLLNWVDDQRIMVAGYSLGGMVGLYATVFDPRIKAVATTCGFGSMRQDAHGDQTEGIRRVSHLRPTLPRLGLFLEQEKRIPYDFHEVLAAIAPRPIFILAPELDQDWFHQDVLVCYRQAAKVFDLYGKRENLVLNSPHDFNRYPPEYQQIVNRWLADTARITD